MSTVNIDLAYYDIEQDDLVKANLPVDYAQISKFVGTTLQIAHSDFFTYGMFRYQQLNGNSYDRFEDLDRLRNDYKILFRYLEHRNTGQLVKAQGPKIDVVEIAEYIGVAGSLSVASAIYGLTQADWVKIPSAKRKKTFDFHHQSSLKGRYLRLEAKGSIVADNTQKPSSVSNHKTSIIDKKDQSIKNGTFSRAKDTCLGLITVADSSRNLRCWIVDPVSDSPDFDPRRSKILGRMYYYLSIIQRISARSHLTISLANRIVALQQMTNFSELDLISLVNPYLKPVFISEAFTNSKSRVGELSAVGKIFRNGESLVYLGVEESILNILIKQDHSHLESFKTVPLVVNSFFKAIMSADESSFVSDGFGISTMQRRNNIIEFEIDMKLYRDSSGFCFGIKSKSKDLTYS
jgi:hypothetical protein